MIYPQSNRIIKHFGSYSKLAALIGVNRVAVWRWTRPRAEGGTDGLIPSARIPQIIELARMHDIEIKPEDWLPN